MVGVNAPQGRHRRQHSADLLQILGGGAAQVQATGEDRNGLLGRWSLRHVQQCGIISATCRLGRYSQPVWASGRMLDRTEKSPAPRDSAQVCLLLLAEFFDTLANGIQLLLH